VAEARDGQQASAQPSKERTLTEASSRIRKLARGKYNAQLARTFTEVREVGAGAPAFSVLQDGSVLGFNAAAVNE
jgi:hypothetical protein